MTSSIINDLKSDSWYRSWSRSWILASHSRFLFRSQILDFRSWILDVVLRSFLDSCFQMSERKACRTFVTWSLKISSRSLVLSNNLITWHGRLSHDGHMIVLDSLRGEPLSTSVIEQVSAIDLGSWYVCMHDVRSRGWVEIWSARSSFRDSGIHANDTVDSRYVDWLVDWLIDGWLFVCLIDWLTDWIK